MCLSKGADSFAPDAGGAKKGPEQVAAWYIAQMGL